MARQLPAEQQPVPLQPKPHGLWAAAMQAPPAPIAPLDPVLPQTLVATFSVVLLSSLLLEEPPQYISD